MSEQKHFIVGEFLHMAMNLGKTMAITYRENLTLVNYQEIDWDDFLDLVEIWKLRDKQPFIIKFLTKAKRIIKEMNAGIRVVHYKVDLPLVIETDVNWYLIIAPTMGET